MSVTFRMPFVIIVSLLLGACATSTGGYITGQVIDAETKLPLPNVYVAIEWEGDNYGGIVHAESECVDIDSTITDKEGRYRFWPWIKPTNPLIGRIDYSVALHKKGYERKKFKKRRITKEEAHQMVPYTGSEEERFKQLHRLSRYTSCYRHSEEGALPFLRSLYDEAREIATSNEEQSFVYHLLHKIEAIELGESEAEKRNEIRRKELDKKPALKVRIIPSSDSDMQTITPNFDMITK